MGRTRSALVRAARTGLNQVLRALQRRAVEREDAHLNRALRRPPIRPTNPGVANRSAVNLANPRRIHLSRWLSLSKPPNSPPQPPASATVSAPQPVNLPRTPIKRWLSLSKPPNAQPQPPSIGALTGNLGCDKSANRQFDIAALVTSCR